MIIALWIVALLIGSAVIMRTTFSTDMSALLPRSPRPAQQILVDQLREGVVSHLILLAIEGAPPDTLAALSRTMADDLRADTAFGVVSNGDPAAFAHDRDQMWRNRYLLSDAITPSHFTSSALHAALASDVQLLGSDMGMFAKGSIGADPTGEMLRLVAAFGAQAHPAMYDGVWVSPKQDRALLMVQTVAAGFDIDAQEQALQRIETAFATARQRVSAIDRSIAANARLLETGPPVFAVRTRAHIKADVARFSLIAAALVAAILLFAYRSVRVLVLALLPVLSGVIAGIASVSLAFGFVHGITLGFGVTLIGEAVDYAIYLLTQTAPGAESAATLPRIWPTLRLGMLTSICGFSAMLLSSFTGFAQLGLFTITGLIAALAVTRWVLPVLSPLGSATTNSVLLATPMLALIRAAAPLRFVVLGFVIAAGIGLVFHHGGYWDDELASMSPLSEAEQTMDNQLRREIGAPDVRYLLAVQAPDRETALTTSEHVAARLDPLIAHGAIGGFDAPGFWLPSLATQRTRQAALPDATTLTASLARAIEGTPFRPGTFAPFLTDVEAARHQPLLHRADLNGTSLTLRADSLLVEAGDRWLAMLPLRGVANPQAVATAIADLDMSGLVFIDLKAESDQLLGTYLHEAINLSFAGSVAIVILLWISLRSLRRTLAVVLPLGAAVICSAALLLTLSGRLSIFNLFGLLLVAAVGSNYCLFFERRLPDTDELGQTRMLASVGLADLCTVIGFGILSFSSIPVLRGIGLTVAIGACLSLLFGAILSPRRRRTSRLDFAQRGP